MEATTGRAAQLHEGIVGAAASLPEGCADLGSRAARAAERVAAAASGSSDRIGPALERMEELHYALLRVSVLAEEPREAGLEEALGALERLAEEEGSSPTAAAGRG